MPAIVVENLSKRYASGTLALDDVSLTVEPGEFVAVVGPSGCGKSTMLRILAGLDDASTGRVSVEAPVDPRRALPSAVVFQEQSLFPWMRVRENVMVGFDSLGLARADVRRRADEMLSLVGLDQFASAYPHQLSGGMKQRVAVARAFAVDAPILFMDEPFGALDEQTRVKLAGELLRLWERTGKSVLFITHGIEEAVTLADRVVVLSPQPGRIRAILPVPFARPRDPIALRGEPAFGALVVRIWELLG